MAALVTVLALATLFSLFFLTRIWKRRANALQTTEAILANTPVGIAILGVDRTIRRANKQYCSIYGFEEGELIGKSARLLYGSAEYWEDVGRRAYPIILAGGTFDADVPNRHRDGREVWLHLTARLVDPADPEAGVVWAIEDVTERKASEARFRRLSNFYAVLSQCNQAIVRCTSEGELFAQICRSAVEFGGMKIAWIGLVEPATKRIRLMSIHGDHAGRLEDVQISVDPNDPFGSGTSGQAVRSNEPYWCQDFERDQAMAPWWKPARDIGCRASASLPLCRNGLPIGVLTLYSGSVNAFDEEARNLLIEMAADISFALDNFAREAERQRIVGERQEALQALRVAAIAFESQECMAITDARHQVLKVNKAFTATTGYTADEVMGRELGFLRSSRHDNVSYEAVRDSVMETGSWQGEIWHRRKDGIEFPGWVTVTAVTGDTGENTHFVATFTDTTRLKASEEEIKYLAFYDPLTGLPNRRLLLDRLQQALAASARGRREGALFFIDLDNFKTINDTLGHEKGDDLLRQVAERLIDCTREGDTVARLGGDEFVVMVEDLCDTPEGAARQAEIVGEKILAVLRQAYRLAGFESHCTSSIGVTLFGLRRDSQEEILKQADLAMYQAKAAGRNALRFFDPAMQAAVTARAILEADLRVALRDEAFFLCYQVQVDGTGRDFGAEALLRWRHPVRGVVSPAEFIPVAEETNLILPLGHWVLETACEQLVVWAARPETVHLTLAVNVSVRQFRQPDFVDQVLGVLKKTGADPRKLKLELTESLVLDDVEDIIGKMTALKAQGVGFSLDDFGTGYSSLSYLKRLPLSQLKVDRSFVRDVLTDPNDAAVVRTIVALARTLGLTVIAEGVETEGQRDFLALHGCHAYQGYLYGRPVPLDEFELNCVNRTGPAQEAGAWVS